MGPIGSHQNSKDYGPPCCPVQTLLVPLSLAECSSDTQDNIEEANVAVSGFRPLSVRMG